MKIKPFSISEKNLILVTALFGFAVVIVIHNAPFITTNASKFHPAFQEKYMANLPIVWAHGISAMVALVLGPFQLWNEARTKWRHIHRRVGMAYLISVFVAAPTGFYMGLMAFGGIVAQFFFAVLSVAWFITAILALTSAKQKKFGHHRHWMILNFAMTFGAVVLRVELALLQLIQLRFEDIYAVVVWTSWIPCVAIGWWVSRKTKWV